MHCKIWLIFQLAFYIPATCALDLNAHLQWMPKNKIFKVLQVFAAYKCMYVDLHNFFQMIKKFNVVFFYRSLSSVIRITSRCNIISDRSFNLFAYVFVILRVFTVNIYVWIIKAYLRENCWIQHTEFNKRHENMRIWADYIQVLNKQMIILANLKANVHR